MSVEILAVSFSGENTILQLSFKNAKLKSFSLQLMRGFFLICVAVSQDRLPFQHCGIPLEEQQCMSCLAIAMSHYLAEGSPQFRQFQCIQLFFNLLCACKQNLSSFSLFCACKNPATLPLDQAQSLTAAQLELMKYFVSER